jgi:cystathionine beta-lyase
MSPVYNCFFSSIRNNGCEVVECALLRTEPDGRYVIDYDDLAAKASDPRARMLLLCNPHNPVGRVWTREELARVYNICIEHGVVVVSDEIHGELTFRGSRYVPYGTVDRTLENAVVLTSPSKSFNTAGLQIANIICARPEWRERIDRAINQNEVCDVNPFGPVALEAAYNESEAWLDALCDYIWQNYLSLCDFFARHLPSLRVTPLEGTYLVWVDCSRLDMDVDSLAARLLDEGRVWVNPGTMYGQQSGRGYIRLNIACPRTQLMEGLRRMADVLARNGMLRKLEN